MVFFSELGGCVAGDPKAFDVSVGDDSVCFLDVGFFCFSFFVCCEGEGDLEPARCQWGRFQSGG